jgi:hypothetical protein
VETGRWKEILSLLFTEVISAVIPEEDGSNHFGARYLQEFRRVNAESNSRQ